MTDNTTPRPWAVGAYSRDGGATRFYITDTNGIGIGRWIGSERDAELIVRAVNAHDDLLAALCLADAWFALLAPYLQELADKAPAYWGPILNNQGGVKKVVVDALAKARGEQS